jgi:long-chain fatty acid transport protein
MKNIAKVLTLSLAVSGLLQASGWRIPEQSAVSVALSGAYIANASGVDAAYYNPANMSFNKDEYRIEGDLTYIYLLVWFIPPL